MTVTSQPAIRSYTAGTWTIDPVHSEVGFSVRHLMVSTARGKFTRFRGQIVTGENPLDSSATATIDMSSIETDDPDRNDHLRSPQFFDVDAYPTMTFRSTAVRRDGERYLLDGELTIKAVTKPISLVVAVGGFGPDAHGDTRAGFTATGALDRRDFGVDFNAVLETGGLVVSNRVDVRLEIEAVLEK